MAGTTSIKPRPVFFFDIDNCVGGTLSPGRLFVTDYRVSSILAVCVKNRIGDFSLVFPQVKKFMSLCMY